MRFLDILGRYEAAEFNQVEAAELLGIDERTFRRCASGSRTTSRPASGSPARQGVGQAGSGRSRRPGRGVVSRALSRLHRQAFSRTSGGGAQVFVELHLDEDVPSVEGASGEGEAARRASTQTPRRPMPGMMLHQDGSRHAWLQGQPALDLIVTLDDATGAIYSAFLIEEEGTASTFRALKETFGAHGLPISLYTDRGAHYFHTPEAGGKIDRKRPTQSGARSSNSASSISGLFAPGARAVGTAFQTLQDRLVKELALAGIDTIEAADAFLRDVFCPPTMRASPRRRPSRARPSLRSRSSTSTRSCASRRSARSATTIAFPSIGSSCISRKVPCAHTSSRRGSKSTSTRTAPTPSSSGHGASAGTTHKERSGT